MGAKWNPETLSWDFDNNSNGLFGNNANYDFNTTPSWVEMDQMGGDLMSKINNGPEGFGFNNSTLSAGGSVLSGLGSLAGAWAGLQGVKLGEKQLGVQQDQWNKNYESQATTINNRIADQNAWKAAQGRTDLGSLVPKYNVG